MSNHQEPTPDDYAKAQREVMDDLERRFPGVDFEAIVGQTPPAAPENAARAMQALVFDTDTIATMTRTDTDTDEPDDIARWAQSLEPSMFTDVGIIEGRLSETMEMLRHPTAWLEADDPMTFRAELSELAERQFRAWIDAVR